MSESCECCTCRHGRATDAIRAALDAVEGAAEEWLEQSTDQEGAFYYLLGEVQEIAKSNLAWPVRKRLLEAIRVATYGPTVTLRPGE